MTILHATLAEAAQGIEAAVKIVMELAPEAVSSITPRERAIYLLQQVRFLVDAGDFVRAAIVANKVPRSVIDCDEHVDAAAYFHRVSVDIAAAQRDGDAFTAHRHKAARALLRAHARATPSPSQISRYLSARRSHPRPSRSLVTLPSLLSSSVPHRRQSASSPQQ
eukprot:gnl/Ergobibamus_cyprinoides/415.p1 GENE.gnl/Ergobibamus_cyprinoides/415~~gnl/Ergobibamus_cyprinoides/415.p1  ORF type:complete len:165 (+),score=38.79 gnl/Ergobibamus_cyprinoides/415:393-887(+)